MKRLPAFLFRLGFALFDGLLQATFGERQRPAVVFTSAASTGSRRIREFSSAVEEPEPSLAHLRQFERLGDFRRELIHPVPVGGAVVAQFDGHQTFVEKCQLDVLNAGGVFLEFHLEWVEGGLGHAHIVGLL